MSKTSVLTALTVAALAGSLAFAGCSSSSDSGTGGKAGSGGSTGGSGGSGGSTGGTGGSGGSTGGTGGGTDGGGCPPAPSSSSPNACEICQDDAHGGCACATAYNDCMNDADCTAIYDCTTAVDDAGNLKCGSLDAAGALCTLGCVAGNPAGKTKYLAWEKCLYCQYCGSACDSSEYCNALDNPPDGGTSDASADGADDSSADATDDSTGDATDDVTGDSAAD